MTQATAFGRQALKVVVIGMVTLILGRTLVTSGINFYRYINPPPPPPPTVGFGRLPGIVFPQENKVTEVTEYIGQFPTGRLPGFGDRAKVFLLTQSSLSLLSDQRAREIASRYKYVFAPDVISPEVLRWTKAQPLSATLEMDLRTYYFTVTTDYLSRPELISAGTLPTEPQAVNRVKGFLGEGGLLPNDVATASGEVQYLKALGGELSAAVSLSDADFLQVDLTRYPIDGVYRMYTPGGYEGTIHAIVSRGLVDDDSIVEMAYRHQEVDYTQVHTYPLRSTESAWRSLQAGQGYVVQTNGGPATIRSVSLGYYDSFEPQEYLQPIYVFEGDNGFMAYVSAIDPELLQPQTTR